MRFAIQPARLAPGRAASRKAQAVQCWVEVCAEAAHSGSSHLELCSKDVPETSGMHPSILSLCHIVLSAVT